MEYENIPTAKGQVTYADLLKTLEKVRQITRDHATAPRATSETSTPAGEQEHTADGGPTA